jgi:hypothetical protein
VILDALLPLVAGALVFATNFALVVGLTAVGHPSPNGPAF